MELTPGIIALIGTIFGGVGLKVMESWLGRSKAKNDDARGIRDELRLTIANQKQEIIETEKDRDHWRQQYYDLRDAKVKVDAELMALKYKHDEQDDGPSHTA